MPYDYIVFKVFILDEFYLKRYLKFESEAMKVNSFLDKYFGSINVNTPYSIFNAVFISKQESNFEFDMELIVDSSNIRTGFI